MDRRKLRLDGFVADGRINILGAFFQALQEVAGCCLAIAGLGKEQELLGMLGGASLGYRVLQNGTDIRDAFAAGHMATIPYLTGTNSDEGSQIGPGNSDWLIKMLGDKFASVRKLYDTTDDMEFRRQLFNDRFFAGPTRQLAADAAKRADAFVYRFGFLNARAHMRGDTGVPHGGEMVFVFGFGPLAALAPPQDTAVADLMQGYWTNFARTGNPNGGNLPSWPRYEGAAPQTLVIEDTSHAVPDFRKVQLDAATP